jgi:hypothetical protein
MLQKGFCWQLIHTHAQKYFMTDRAEDRDTILNGEIVNPMSAELLFGFTRSQRIIFNAVFHLDQSLNTYITQIPPCGLTTRVATPITRTFVHGTDVNDGLRLILQAHNVVGGSFRSSSRRLQVV